jgi:hypothetical protein
MEGRRNKIRKHEECRMQNAELRMQKAQCRIRNAELGMQN